MASNKQLPDCYAVAIRDTTMLYLELRISRADSGVYVMFARPSKTSGRRIWDPHTSYHKDGRHHQKSFNKCWGREQRQPLNNNFRGIEPVIAAPLTSAVTSGIQCNPQDFLDVLEVPRADILPHGHNLVSVSVDLAEPGVQPVLPPGAVIVEQKFYNGRNPCLVVTVYKSAPLLQIQSSP